MKKAYLVLGLLIFVVLFSSCKHSDNNNTKGKDQSDTEITNQSFEDEDEPVDNTGDKPTVRLMLKDVSDIPEFRSTENDVWEVVDAKETLARKLDDKTYETTIQVKLANDIYKEAYRSISLLYDYYDIGGWVLNSFSDITEVSGAIPQAGMYEEAGMLDIYNFYDGLFTLVSHDTNIKDKTDIFVFTREMPGELFTQTSEVKLVYRISDESGLWTVFDAFESDRKCQFTENNRWIIDSQKSNEPMSGSYPFIHCVKIKEFNENTVTLNVIDYEDIYWISTGIYGQGYYIDDFYTHFEGRETPDDFQTSSIMREDGYHRLYYAWYTLTGTVSYDPEFDGYRIDISDRDFSESRLFFRPEGVYWTGDGRIGDSPYKLQSFSERVNKAENFDDGMRNALFNISF